MVAYASILAPVLPNAAGHVLVASRRHARTLYDLAPEEAAAVMQTAHRVALAVRRVFEEQLPDYDYEHLFCDNCSTDETVARLVVARISELLNVARVWPWSVAVR